MARTTIPCDHSTHDRLESLRGDRFQSWDAFLNALADRWEQPEYEIESDGEVTVTLPHKPVLDRLDDLEARLPKAVAEELRR